MLTIKGHILSGRPVYVLTQQPFINFYYPTSVLIILPILNFSREYYFANGA